MRSSFFVTMLILAMFMVCLVAAFGRTADDIAPHSPQPPCPNCQCGCTETGRCFCKDCDHPLLTKPKTLVAAPNAEQGMVSRKDAIGYSILSAFLTSIAFVAILTIKELYTLRRRTNG